MQVGFGKAFFISLTVPHTQGPVLLVEILSIGIASGDRMINYISKAHGCDVLPSKRTATWVMRPLKTCHTHLFGILSNASFEKICVFLKAWQSLERSKDDINPSYRPRPVVARATNITNIFSLKLPSNHSWILTKNRIELSYILPGKTI